MILAASRTQGEAEGGIKAQQVVVGIAEEVEQHLQDKRLGTSGRLHLDGASPLGNPLPSSVSFCCLRKDAPST